MAYDDVYAVMPDRVRGYERKDSLGLRNIDYDDHSAYAAGGLLSSAGDLFRWSRAVTGAKLFRADLVEESLTPRLGSYGYGWQVRRFFESPGSESFRLDRRVLEPPDSVPGGWTDHRRSLERRQRRGDPPSVRCGGTAVRVARRRRAGES